MHGIYSDIQSLLYSLYLSLSLYFSVVFSLSVAFNIVRLNGFFLLFVWYKCRMRALVKTTGPLHIPTKLNCASVCVNTTFALSKKPFINVFFNNFYSFSYIYIGLAVHSVALRIFYNIFHIEHVKYMPCFLHMKNSHRLFMFCLSLFELFAIRLNSAVACVHRHFVS